MVAALRGARQLHTEQFLRLAAHWIPLPFEQASPFLEALDNPALAFAASVTCMLPHRAAQVLLACASASGVDCSKPEAVQVAKTGQSVATQAMGSALLNHPWPPTEAYKRLQEFQRP